MGSEAAGVTAQPQPALPPVAPFSPEYPEVNEGIAHFHDTLQALYEKFVEAARVMEDPTVPNSGKFLKLRDYLENLPEWNTLPTETKAQFFLVCGQDVDKRLAQNLGELTEGDRDMLDHLHQAGKLAATARDGVRAAFQEVVTMRNVATDNPNATAMSVFRDTMDSSLQRAEGDVDRIQGQLGNLAFAMIHAACPDADTRLYPDGLHIDEADPWDPTTWLRSLWRQFK